MLIYPRGWDVVQGVWTSGVIRVLLERSTSAYTPDIDHDYLDDFTGGGGVEISVASYARQTLGSAAKAWDGTKDQYEYDAADIAFGSLEAGQTVKAAIYYRQVGGDDSTPGNDELILYDDGKIDVVCAANFSSSATTVYVQQLEANLPSGTAVDFGGGASSTLTAPASRGARSIAVSSMPAGASAGAVASGVLTDSILPAVLQNGPFSIALHADGLITLGMRNKPWTA